MKNRNSEIDKKDANQNVLHFDWQDWLPFIEGSDLSESQKQELIETLWQIVIAFVDLGWHVGNAGGNACENSCGQAQEKNSETAFTPALMLQWKEQEGARHDTK